MQLESVARDFAYKIAVTAMRSLNKEDVWVIANVIIRNYRGRTDRIISRLKYKQWDVNFADKAITKSDLKIYTPKYYHETALYSACTELYPRIFDLT